MNYLFGNHDENPSIGVSMNTVAKALDSACNGICTLIQFYENCTVVKLSASESGGGDDFCSLLKKIYDQLKYGDVSGLAENTDKLRIGIVKAQGILINRLAELRPLSDTARKIQNAFLIATVVSATVALEIPNIYIFACTLICFGVFVVSSLAFLLIEYQIQFHQDARKKIEDLCNDLIKARFSSLDSSKSSEYAGAIKELGKTLKCTCF